MRLAAIFFSIATINAVLAFAPSTTQAPEVSSPISTPTPVPAVVQEKLMPGAPEQVKQDPKQVGKLPTANDAAALAVADLRTLPEHDQRYQRYIWITDANHESMQAIFLTVNYFSRGTVLIKPVALGKDKLMVLRVDLRAYAPQDNDLRQVVGVWEELAFDGAFGTLITKDTVRFAERTGITVPPLKSKVKKTRDKVVEIKGYVDMAGKTVPPTTVTTREQYDAETELDVVRVIDDGLDPLIFQELFERTGSDAPIVSHGYFAFRTLTTIQDSGVYKTLFSGIYTRFAGIPKTLDELLEKLGVGNVKGKVKAKDIFDKLRSDQRVAVFRSEVTGHPRRIDFLRTLAGRVGDTQSLFIITRDLKRKSVDLATHPVLNLLDIQEDGAEAIWEAPTSLHQFAAINGKGEIVDQVPDDIATDPTVPSPHNANLQAAISCIRCHGKPGFGGWQPVRNDAKILLKTLDVFGDLSLRSQTDAIDRLAGLYAGDVESRLLPRGRDDYASAILKATGPWKASKDQTDVVQLSAEAIARVVNDYWYKMVDAADALRDLGIEPDANAAAMLSKLLPPIPGGEVFLEDARIGALKANLSIPRSDYELIRGFVRVRAMASK